VTHRSLLGVKSGTRLLCTHVCFNRADIPRAPPNHCRASSSLTRVRTRIAGCYRSRGVLQGWRRHRSGRLRLRAPESSEDPDEARCGQRTCGGPGRGAKHLTPLRRVSRCGRSSETRQTRRRLPFQQYILGGVNPTFPTGRKKRATSTQT
jgi:hypothetical protein